MCVCWIWTLCSQDQRWLQLHNFWCRPVSCLQHHVFIGFLFQNYKAQINYHKYSFLNRNNLSEKKYVLQHMLDMLGKHVWKFLFWWRVMKSNLSAPLMWTSSFDYRVSAWRMNTFMRYLWYCHLSSHEPNPMPKNSV